MSFYHMSYRELLGIPIKTFWFLSGNIERISAQKDIRALNIAAHAQDQESYQDIQKALIEEVGTVAKMKFDPIRTAVRDEEGFMALKEMATQV